MQKGKGKALRNFSLALFSLVLKQDSANRMEAYMQHTICGKKLQNGVGIKTVSGMLGHFSADFTLDTYAHVTTSAKREAAKAMGNILSGAV